jgi:hypothetical protein
MKIGLMFRTFGAVQEQATAEDRVTCRPWIVGAAKRDGKRNHRPVDSAWGLT